MPHDIKYEIEKFIGYNQSTDTISYEVVKTETDLDEALRIFNNFVHSNPTHVYRFIRIIIDEVKTSEPEE